MAVAGGYQHFGETIKDEVRLITNLMCNSEAPSAGYKKTLSSLAARGREAEGQAQGLIISIKDPEGGGHHNPSRLVTQHPGP